jgi:toxin-antitoxin system PIN domain toxin
MTPDVNILVAASRSDHPHHAPARAWLEQAIANSSQGAAFSLQPMVIASFLRLVTHPKIFVHPTPMTDALNFIGALLEAADIEPATLGGEWPILRQLCLDKGLSNNDVPDAWLAAAAIHQSEHVVSFDADFRRLLPRNQFTRLQL